MRDNPNEHEIRKPEEIQIRGTTSTTGFPHGRLFHFISICANEKRAKLRNGLVKQSSWQQLSRQGGIKESRNFN